jgi:hypothetical protein
MDLARLDKYKSHRSSLEGRRGIRGSLRKPDMNTTNVNHQDLISNRIKSPPARWGYNRSSRVVNLGKQKLPPATWVTI